MALRSKQGMLGFVGRGPSIREVEEDHVAVRDMAARIQHELSDERKSPEDLAALLEAFRSRLEAHFALEERRWSGFQGPDCDRTTAHWVEGLVREHREIERRIGDVLSRLGAEQGTRRAPSAAVASAIRALIDDLYAHELSETKLFQRRVFEGS